ncbi:hypothetical protein AAH994_07850 [Weeksellaceae bacterium A-14]
MMEGVFLLYFDKQNKSLFLQKLFLTVVFLWCLCPVVISAQNIAGLENIHISGDARIVVVEQEQSHVIDQEALASLQKSGFRAKEKQIATAAKKGIRTKSTAREKEKKTVEKPFCQIKIEPAASESFISANSYNTCVAAGVQTFVLAAAKTEDFNYSFGLGYFSKAFFSSYPFCHTADFHQKLFARPPPSRC